jgi:putative tryptophan/tyrosine transport system substrate-binding protein
MRHISELIMRMAQDNPSWGYIRMQAALADPGHKVGRGTIANVLKRNGIESSPERSKHMTWSTFLKAHWQALAASGFLIVEVWTRRGLVTHYLLFVISLSNRGANQRGYLLGDPGVCAATWTIEGDRMNKVQRRKFLLASSALLIAPFTANAQPRGKVWRIGYIQTAMPDEQEQLSKALDEGLRELGYVEGRNVVFERRFAMGKQERLPDLAAELVRLNVDVIVTGANPVIAAVKQATATIPVVMATSRDPVGAGFIASLARPGGNITGLTNDAGPEIVGKYLELLKEAIPRASRVALLWNPLPPGAETYRKSVESAAVKLGLSLQAVEARGRNEFEGAFAAMARQRVDAVVVLSDPVFISARKQVVELATKYRLPAVYHAREFVEIGGWMSYGPSLNYQFRRASVYVDKILKGAKPGDLPVEQAARFELVINLKTARALGLTIPQALLQRADEVIK